MKLIKLVVICSLSIFLFSCNGNDDMLNNSPSQQNLENSTNSNLTASKIRIGNDIELKNISDLASPIKSESPNYTFEFTKQVKNLEKNFRFKILEVL